MDVSQASLAAIYSTAFTEVGAGRQSALPAAPRPNDQAQLPAPQQKAQTARGSEVNAERAGGAIGDRDARGPSAAQFPQTSANALAAQLIAQNGSAGTRPKASVASNTAAKAYEQAKRLAPRIDRSPSGVVILDRVTRVDLTA
jgi:hypothetical protein